MVVIDETLRDVTLSSELQNVTIDIQLENDEPPIISSNNTSQTFEEEGGPIELFDIFVTITDADNLFEHTLIQEIQVTLDNPIATEDMLLINGSAISGFNYTFSCDEEEEGGCYEEFLMSLQYNNTNREPVSFRIPRRITVEV